MNLFEDILKKIKNNSGKPGGWPGYYEYKVENDSAIIKLTDHKKISEKKQLRGIDPWGLAFFETINEKSKVNKLSCRIEGQVSLLNFEALKRRLSFLDINNPEQSFELILNNEVIKLYSKEDLINRPKEEIIRQETKQRLDNDKPGRIEKDFQTFLFGKGIEKDVRSNERLA